MNIWFLQCLEMSLEYLILTDNRSVVVVVAVKNIYQIFSKLLPS